MFAESAFGVTEVTIELDAHPVAFGQAEIAVEAKAGVGGDAALPLEDGRDARERHMDVLGQAVGGDLWRVRPACGRWRDSGRPDLLGGAGGVAQNF